MKKITLVLITAIATTTASYAQINLNGTWTPIGATSITKVTNDPDGGDGDSDGALLINGNTSATGQGALYTFGGTMEAGKTYAIDTYIYNSGASYCKLTVSLYNSTTGVVLANSPAYVLQQGKISELSASLSYTALDSDTGGVLQLRYIRNDDGNVSRDFSIDNTKLNGVVISSPLLSKNKK